MKPQQMKQFRELLDTDTDPFGLRISLKANSVLRQWNELFGDVIGQNSWPELFRDGRLTVATTSSVWLQELSFQKEMILQKLNAAANEQLFTEVVLKTRSRRPKPKQPVRYDLPPAIARLKIVDIDDRMRLRIERQTASEQNMEKRAFLMERLELFAKLQLQRKKAGWNKCPKCGCYHIGAEAICSDCRNREPSS